MKSFLYSLVVLVALIFSGNTYSADDSVKSFSRISYTDQSLANKILISFHHGIMEINRDEKYIIAQLSDAEKKKLAGYALTITHANQWQDRFERHISNSKSASASAASADSIDGYACYATVEETYEQAESLVGQHNTLASWIDIGDSWMKANQQEGYDLMVLKITNSEVVKEKPILFVHSSMHAREYAPAALNLDFAKWLLNNYQTDAEARWIVDNREVHLMLHMNPDGRKVAEQQVYQRKNMNQQHCASSTVGVDLNRNFAFTWNTTVDGSSSDECSEVYRGVSPESEPETQAVSNYIRSLYPDERGELESDAAPLNKSGLHLDIHSYGRLVLWPNGHTGEPSANDNGFVHLGNKFAWFNDYQPQQSIGLYPTDGTSDAVSYHELGVSAFTFELGTSFFQDCAAYNQQIKPDNLLALAYAAKVSEAPYLLPLGIDVSSIRLNKSVGQTTVSDGATVELEIVASNDRTKLTGLTKRVSQFEYVINDSFDNEEAIIVLDQEIESDGVAGSVVITQIDTADLSLGTHMLSVRVMDNSGGYGVVNSAFIHIEDNSAPLPSFTVNCQDLTCTFDASKSEDVDGEIAFYSWGAASGNAQPNTIGDGEVIEHTFDSAGEYTVSLTVEDNEGLQAVNNRVINVTATEVITVTPNKSKSSSGGGEGYGILLLLLFSAQRFKKAELT